MALLHTFGSFVLVYHFYSLNDAAFFDPHSVYVEHAQESPSTLRVHFNTTGTTGATINCDVLKTNVFLDLGPTWTFIQQ